MAEYKYRALGWKDDDIASLNVVDGTAADNQVVLQITKQGAGGTIDGPAIVGKDGITINKPADSEKIEISGKGCVQHHDIKGYYRAYVLDSTGWDTTMIIRSEGDNSENTLMRRKKDGSGEIVMPETPVDLSITNKKYVDDNFVKKVTTSSPYTRAYTISADGTIQGTIDIDYSNGSGAQRLIRRDSYGAIYIPDSSIGKSDYNFAPGQEAVNKKYVDEADKDLRLKLSNLEQALNGYILDTTKEAYADLDSAVLKNSVAVGDNVYPIADKTRALVSRIEGKTTKMVQLLDRSKFSATTTNRGVTFTNNGNGSVTVTGTLIDGVSENIYSISNLTELIKGHKYLLSGCPEGGESSTYMLRLNVYNPANHGWEDSGNGCIFIFDIESYDRNSGGIYIYERTVGTEINRTYTPQLFDLTAMGREDITTVEQFKAEFPDFYPYENGNIYPAKISGVKFTGKNLFNINQFERYKPNDTSDARVLNDKLLITGYPVNLPNNHYFSNLIRSLKPNTQYAISVNVSNYISDASGAIVFIGKNNVTIKDFIFYRNGYNSAVFSLTQEDIDTFDYVRIYGNLETRPPIIMTNLQIEENSAPTAYEPYTEPVSVTLPETYDLHGIGNYKDYLEITKNENNELYTLKKVQVIDKRVFDGTEAWSENMVVENHYQVDVNGMLFGNDINPIISSHYPTNKTPSSYYSDLNYAIMAVDGDRIRIKDVSFAETGLDGFKAYLAAQFTAGTPVTAYYALATPVETVIATNLTYEQVTAIRHNGGLIEVEGNTNKGYARPTVTNTIVYRLTAKNTTEG